eukprot:328037-Chlamydomonas_euryale.AAC.1
MSRVNARCPLISAVLMLGEVWDLRDNIFGIQICGTEYGIQSGTSGISPGRSRARELSHRPMQARGTVNLSMRAAPRPARHSVSHAAPAAR